MDLTSFFADLVALLEANSTVGAVVGDRVYVERFPRGTSEPCITLELFDGEHEDFLGAETANQAMVIVNFVCWSKIARDTLTTRDVLKELFTAYIGTWNSRTEIVASIFRGDVTVEQNPNSQLLRRVIQFEFWFEVDTSTALTASIQTEVGTDMLTESGDVLRVEA